ncbi:MAG: serine hydrolase domain-containing protein [Lewinella sp.]|uniref:serine hydrolase domain-containing protein n=1 Tax=Lewinella sp. TaxID=2004506 RepID=UPI003D6BB309
MKYINIIFLFLTLQLSAQSIDLATQVEAVVQPYMAEEGIVGLAVGVVQDGQVLLSSGYGTKEIGRDAPVDSLTNFLTASISKLFTATAIMQLHEQGRIDLQGKVTDYLPEFTMKDDRYKDITVYQLLTHTSGIANYFNPRFIQPPHDSVALSMFAEKLATKKLRFEPGVSLSEKTYSNSGYNMLGLIIERIAGCSFSAYMEEHLLSPVGMENSSFFIDSIPVERRSIPHRKQWLTGRISPSDYYPDIPQDKPCGNLNSCTADLCKWMLHNLSIYDTTKIHRGVIAPSSLRQMWTAQEEIDGYSTSVGLGWWIVNSATYGDYLFHVGNDPGFSATLMLWPEHGFGLVLLCNGMYPMDTVWNKIPFAIVDLFKKEWQD